MQDSHDALVLCILAVVVPAPPHPTPDGTVDRIEGISIFRINLQTPHSLELKAVSNMIIN